MQAPTVTSGPVVPKLRWVDPRRAPLELHVQVSDPQGVSDPWGVFQPDPRFRKVLGWVSTHILHIHRYTHTYIYIYTLDIHKLYTHTQRMGLGPVSPKNPLKDEPAWHGRRTRRPCTQAALPCPAQVWAEALRPGEGVQ